MPPPEDAPPVEATAEGPVEIRSFFDRHPAEEPDPLFSAAFPPKRQVDAVTEEALEEEGPCCALDEEVEACCCATLSVLASEAVSQSAS